MKKRIKSLILVMTAFVMTMMFGVLVSAATTAPEKITGLKQTDAGKTSLDISWDSQLDCEYLVQYSTDGVNWTEENMTYSTSNYKYGLSEGATYYARVRGRRSEYISGEGTKYYYGPYSDILEVITTPAEVATVSQTDATYNTATFTWGAVEGATQYDVYKTVNGIETFVGTVNTNAITLTGLSRENFSISVISVKKSPAGFEAKTSYGKTLYSSDINLIPDKAQNVYIDAYYKSLKQVCIKWNKCLFADGYEVQVFKGNAKKPMTDIKEKGEYVYARNIVDKSYYKVRVRAYTTVNGQIKYGAWSDYTHFAQQTTIKLKYVGSSKLKISWSKVKGATSYTVYMSTKKNSGYKAVKTLKKTSYTATRFKKKKLSRKKTYYVYVVANKKVGKKTEKSAVSECYYLYKTFY